MVAARKAVTINKNGASNLYLLQKAVNTFGKRGSTN